MFEIQWNFWKCPWPTQIFRGGINNGSTLHCLWHADVTISLTLNDLLCPSAMSIWYKHNIHTHTSCVSSFANFVPCVQCCHSMPQSVIFSNYHTPSSKSQGSSVPGFMFLVNHVQGVCSTLCNASVTSVLNINIPSLSLQTRGLHAPTITHPSTDTRFPSCSRRKPTFVL